MNENTNTAPQRGVPVWAQIIIWTLLVGLLVVLAIGLTRVQQGHAEPGAKLPNLQMSLFSGYEYNNATQVSLAGLSGKVVVINFWASWCKTCEQEAADLESAWQGYKDSGKVVFIGMDWVDTEPDARIYLKKFGITYPNGPDLGTKNSQVFRVSGAPETYIIDQKGVLQYARIGIFNSTAEIQSIIDPLLK
jgi:cytochrome c biogenesis protein CcmG/thiol:disulfide interchange protein DsbE